MEPWWHLEPQEVQVSAASSREAAGSAELGSRGEGQGFGGLPCGFSSPLLSSQGRPAKRGAWPWVCKLWFEPPSAGFKSALRESCHCCGWETRCRHQPVSAPWELHGALPALENSSLKLSFQLGMRWFKSGKSCLCARQLKLKVIKAKSFPAAESTEHVEIA